MKASLGVWLLLALSAVGIADDAWTISDVHRTPRDSPSTGPYEEVSVRFVNGKVYRIPLYRADVIAVLRGSDGTHFLMVVGASCMMCDEINMIRLFMLGGAELEGSDSRYSYPGSLADYMAPHALVSRTRTFYGNCLPEPGDVVIWFDEQIQEDDKWNKSTSIVRLSEEGETIFRYSKGEVTLASVEERSKSASCTELAGRDGTVEP
jgi:hypothetical protein